jgi:hypothetical protein
VPARRNDSATHASASEVLPRVRVPPVSGADTTWPLSPEVSWRGHVQVTLHQARHLSTDSSVPSPVAIISVDNPYQRHKTAVVSENVNPEWINESFSLYE